MTAASRVTSDREAAKNQPAWMATVARYSRPDRRKSLWQIANTLLPLAGIWYLMYQSYFCSYWLMLLLAVPAAGLRVRVFIIQHDCGHRAYFASRRANDLLGFVCGVMTLTPYHFWRRAHALHHATSGNLSHRGQGDVLTLTVAEYVLRSRWGRLRYRVYRNPLFMSLLGAMFLFLVRQRFTTGLPRTWYRERRGIHATNLLLLVVLALAASTIGVVPFLVIELPVITLAAVVGMWLFYVQHQFEDAYWQPRRSWDFAKSALAGSSYYRLPSVLQWFTGNIGFHHIHHLNSRIPNYYLAACYEAEPCFRQAVTFGFWDSLKCTRVKLWDERSQRMIGFVEACDAQLVPPV
jgi:acyl-lipid omega-6 desaturase (Delta-12 desaturase)